jgi:hypothetical protein
MPWRLEQGLERLGRIGSSTCKVPGLFSLRLREQKFVRTGQTARSKPPRLFERLSIFSKLENKTILKNLKVLEPNSSILAGAGLEWTPEIPAKTFQPESKFKSKEGLSYF